MNEFFYELPAMHCSRPIELVAGASKALICNSESVAYQTKNEVDNYCTDTPLAIEEKFFKCKFSTVSCLSEAVAQAQGWTSVFYEVCMVVLVAFVVKIQFTSPDIDVVEDDIENERGTSNALPHHPTIERTEIEMSEMSEVAKLNRKIIELKTQQKEFMARMDKLEKRSDEPLTMFSSEFAMSGTTL